MHERGKRNERRFKLLGHKEGGNGVRVGVMGIKHASPLGLVEWDL